MRNIESEICWNVRFSGTAPSALKSPLEPLLLALLHPETGILNLRIKLVI